MLRCLTVSGCCPCSLGDVKVAIWGKCCRSSLLLHSTGRLAPDTTSDSWGPRIPEESCASCGTILGERRRANCLVRTHALRLADRAQTRWKLLSRWYEFSATYIALISGSLASAYSNNTQSFAVTFIRFIIIEIPAFQSGIAFIIISKIWLAICIILHGFLRFQFINLFNLDVLYFLIATIRLVKSCNFFLRELFHECWIIVC